MTLQVLISTMHQTDFGLLEKMNIQSDAIVVNQCERNEIVEFDYNGHHVLWISLRERGVGLSRNTALMRATADIVLFADDDVVYEDGYADIVLNEFAVNPRAGLIIFNLPSLNPERPEICVKQVYWLHWYNCLKFGAVRIAVRRQLVVLTNTYFSLLFGGGAMFSSGEDSLFVLECLRKHIRGFASDKTIGTIKQVSSTWFKGYTDTYLMDKGTWLACAFPVMKHLLATYYGWRLRRQIRNIGYIRITLHIVKGFRSIQKLCALK